MSKAIPRPLLKLILLLLCGTGLMFGNLSAKAGDIVTYIHTDINGNPVAKTNSVGAVIWRQTYTPYGETNQQSDPDGSGYTGHRHDAATGLVYMQARYYDPKIARFLSPDPVTFSPDHPQNFNRYWYARGNPYKYVDPDGRNVTTFLAGVLYESAQAITGNGFDGSHLAGALVDGYNGEGGGVVNAVVQDLSLAGAAVSGAGAAGALLKKGAVKAISGTQNKAIRSLEKQISKHQVKLKEFKANPTIRPGMEKQPTKIIKGQQKQRVKHLKNEIKTFKKNIDKIKKGELDS